MELERHFIERTDFSAARRGYDPDEVDRHLREIAEAVEELRRSQPSSSLAGQAAEQVRIIVEAAEGSAGEIEQKARAEAHRMTTDATEKAERATREADEQAAATRTSAEADARQTREQAEADAASHIQKVQEAATSMLSRSDNIDSELNGLVESLRSSVESLVERLRTGSTSLSSELDEIRAGLADVREAAPAPEPAYAAAEAQEDTPEAAYEAAPEEEEAGEEAETPSYETAEYEGVEGGDEAFQATVAHEVQEELPAETEQYTEEYEAAEAEAEEAPAPSGGGGEGAEGARLIALNMALNGTPREETARYLEENFDLEDQESILDEVYARAGG